MRFRTKLCPRFPWEKIWFPRKNKVSMEKKRRGDSILLSPLRRSVKYTNPTSGKTWFFSLHQAFGRMTNLTDIFPLIFVTNREYFQRRFGCAQPQWNILRPSPRKNYFTGWIYHFFDRAELFHFGLAQTAISRSHTYLSVGRCAGCHGRAQLWLSTLNREALICVFLVLSA